MVLRNGRHRAARAAKKYDDFNMRKQTNKPKSEFCDPEEKRCLPVHIGKEVKDVEETAHHVAIVRGGGKALCASHWIAMLATQVAQAVGIGKHCGLLCFSLCCNVLLSVLQCVATQAVGRQ